MTELDEWDLEWDRMAHTPADYQREIKGLRERCIAYAREVEKLRREVADLDTIRQRQSARILRLSSEVAELLKEDKT